MRGPGAFLRWRLQRLTADLPADPDPAEVPTATPTVATPRAPSGEVRITSVGHATFLLQIGGLNLLTDPVWSERVSPVRWGGPRRLVPPGLPFEDLPPLDGVLLSHDHFDHLDRPTVERLRDRFGSRLPWFTPLGFSGWLGRRGVERVVEFDWWEGAELPAAQGAGAAPGNGGVRLVCLPVRHWCRRGLKTNERLWGSWAILVGGGPRVYFGGDSGACPAFARIGQALGPFDVTLLPVGAYAPRWFMGKVHMDPEEAVRAYLDLGGRGELVGMHWGVFRLSDEGPLEPLERVPEAWRTAMLPPEDLHMPAIGETVVV